MSKDSGRPRHGARHRNPVGQTHRVKPAYRAQHVVGHTETRGIRGSVMARDGDGQHWRMRSVLTQSTSRRQRAGCQRDITKGQLSVREAGTLSHSTPAAKGSFGRGSPAPAATVAHGGVNVKPICKLCTKQNKSEKCL